MVVVVEAPVVFCAKATEKCNKNTNINCLKAKILLITIHCKTYYNLPIANCSLDRAQAVGWPEPELLWSNGTPAYWILPESSCHCEKNSHIVLRPKHRNIGERDERLSTLYLQLLIILDFWLF
jgi:hypothetical protein